MPFGFHVTRDVTPQAAPPRPHYGAPKKTVRKVVDADGNRYLVRSVVREPPFEHVREQRSRQSQGVFQEVRPSARQPSANGRSQGQPRVEPQRRGYSGPHQPSNGVHQPSNGNGARQPSNGLSRQQGSRAPTQCTPEMFHQPPQQPQYVPRSRQDYAPRPRREDPYLAAERARREKKKAKYMKWLMFFVS